MIKADIAVEYIDHMGSDLSVVNAARVSFDKRSEWARFTCEGCNNSVETTCSISCPAEKSGAKEDRQLKKEDEKLIKYLAKHEHKSPFNHTFITVKVKAPIFVARQLVKHKFLPWNEESRRYINTEPEFYFPDTWRLAAESVKQGSSDDAFDGVIGGMTTGAAPDFILELQVGDALKIYNDMIKAGICNEQARMVLPQNMMVNWYWSGTLGAFADMLVLRLDKHTQKESRIVAEQIRDIIEPLFPVSLPALLAK